jgi:hypothetical protein
MMAEYAVAMSFSFSPFGNVDFGGEKVVGVPGTSEAFNVMLSPPETAWEPSCGAAANAIVMVAFCECFGEARVGHAWSESQSGPDGKTDKVPKCVAALH